MIHIDRADKEPDEDWIKAADALTASLLKAPTVAERNKIIDDNETLWGELKDFLLGISDQKCWYSESKDSFNHSHVDHFRPKKEAIGIDKKDHGGYWWLAFEWTNYRFSGGVGNVRKRSKFAVRNHKANSPTDSIDDEIIYLLDPIEEEDVLKITFNSNGEAMPIANDGWDKEQADYTIETLNLNFKNLKEARKVRWSKCSRLISETQKLMDENSLYPSAKKKGQIKEKLKQIKELAKKESDFTATTRACLNSTGRGWAIHCIN